MFVVHSELQDESIGSLRDVTENFPLKTLKESLITTSSLLELFVKFAVGFSLGIRGVTVSVRLMLASFRLTETAFWHFGFCD